MGQGLTPFTLEHFSAWASDLILDNEEPWLLEPFQEKFIADVFSNIRTAWMVVPEGNGKTTLMAGLALYHCQHIVSAWVPIAASSREQAQIMFRQAVGLIYRSPVITDVFKAQEGNRRIKCESMDSRIQVLAADERTGDGIIPTLALIDELHRHRDLALYRTWLGKLRKRNAQLLVISTAGEVGSEFEEERRRMRRDLANVTHEGRTFTRAASASAVMHE